MTVFSACHFPSRGEKQCKSVRRSQRFPRSKFDNFKRGKFCEIDPLGGINPTDLLPFLSPLHEMPSVSFHLNSETLKLLLSQSFFFIEEDFSLLRLPPHVGRYKFSVGGKVMKL